MSDESQNQTSPAPEASESAEPSESGDPKDLEDLDRAEFVGEASVGDAHPGEFLSNDVSRQSPDGPESQDGQDSAGGPRTAEQEPDTEEDA